MRATPRCLLVAVLSFSSMHLIEAGATGTCFDLYSMAPETCDDVYNLCSSSSCNSFNDGMSYTCYDYPCDGTYSVPAATTATPTISSSSGSSSSSAYDVESCNKMTISSCDEAASQFQSVGCSCFSCVESNGNIEASCSAPFSCQPQISQATDDTIDAPEMGAEEYGIVFAVYLATAAVVAGAAKIIAELCSQEKKGASTKDLVMQTMPPVMRFVYKHSFASFIQEDGSPTGFVDYFCDNKELFGLLDCRKKTAAVRPRWMRFLAIVSTLMVTISLAFLLGTVVYNNENCASTQVVSYCHTCECNTYCNDVNIGCSAGCQCIPNYGCSAYSCQGADSEISSNSATSKTTTACQGASVKTSEKANWVTTALTKAVSLAGSIAVHSADDGSHRQKFFLLVNFAAAIGLIIFGVSYSESLSKEAAEGDEGNPSARRRDAIGTTLLNGWWYEQLVGFGTIILHFIVLWGVYHVVYRPRLEEVKRAGGAAVHPHDDQGLDDSIMKTEGVKGGVGSPVTIDEVRLQAPTQQQ